MTSGKLLAWFALACVLLICLSACTCDRIGGASQTRPAAPASRPSSSVDWTFDNLASDGLPPGWQVGATRPTAALANWQILADPSAPSPPNVFALTHSDNYDGTFNLAIADGPFFQDVEVTLRAKAVSGKEDQGGGPIWRCQDENNYYICRFNPLESNFRVYVVADGKRRQLDSAKLELEANRWYVVRIRMIGDQITCWLDGQQLLQASDSTIPRAGRVGLWTKADAVSSFDDLRVRAL